MRIGNIEILFEKYSDKYCQHEFPVTKEMWDEEMKGKKCPKCHKPYQPWLPWYRDVDALLFLVILMTFTAFIVGVVVFLLKYIIR